jgi:hypothetical protein
VSGTTDLAVATDLQHHGTAPSARHWEGRGTQAEQRDAKGRAGACPLPLAQPPRQGRDRGTPGGLDIQIHPLVLISMASLI